MIDKKELFIDLMAAIPDNTDWKMQFWLPPPEAMHDIPITRNSDNIDLKFNSQYRDQISKLAERDLYRAINWFEVRENGKKLVEAFDGFVIVTVSKDFDISKTSLPRYLDDDILFVADDW